MIEPDLIILGCHEMAKENPPPDGRLYDWEREFAEQFAAGYLAVLATRPQLAMMGSEFELVCLNPSARMELIVGAVDQLLAKHGVTLSQPVIGWRRVQDQYSRYLRAPI